MNTTSPRGTLTVTVYWAQDAVPSVFNHVEQVALGKWPDLYTLEWGSSRIVSIPHRSVMYIDVSDEEKKGK